MLLVSVTLLFAIPKLMYSIFINREIELENKMIELHNELIIQKENYNLANFSIWKEKIHDYKYKIILLKKWSESNDYFKIESYINEEYDYIYNNKIDYSNNSLIESLICAKEDIAHNNNINFVSEVQINNKCIINDFDLVCLIGNLLDNALEASRKVNEGFVSIIIKTNKNLLLIKVENSYNREIKNNHIEKDQEKLFHGIGIKSIKSIITKYNGTYETNIDEQIYKTLISLENK